MTDLIGRLAYQALPRFTYQGRNEGSWFFRRPEKGRIHSWVRVAHSRKKRRFRVQLAVSPFQAAQPVFLNNHLVLSAYLSDLASESFRYGSKRGATTVLGRMAASLQLFRDDFLEQARFQLERALREPLEVLDELQGLEPAELQEVLTQGWGSGLALELVELAEQKLEGDQLEDEMSAFLRELCNEGEALSQGAFTFEPEVARRKMARFQLEHPRSFVVHLVAGAVAHQARQVCVSIDSDDVIVDFDGPDLDRLELEHLFASLLTFHPAQAAFHHWALGLQTAAALGPRWLWLQSGQLMLHVESEQQWVDEARSQQSRIHFRAPVDLEAVKRFFTQLNRPLPEVRFLRERCGLAPIPIEVNQEPVNPGWPSGYVTGLKLTNAEVPWKLPSDDHHVEWQERTSPGEFSALLGIGPTTRARLRLVVHGLNYQPPPIPWSPVCEVTAWLASGSADLSHQGLVSDLGCLKALELLKAQEEAFINRLVESLENLPEVSRQTLEPRLLEILAQGAYREVLETLALWPVVGGGRVSTVELARQSDVLFTRRHWEHSLKEDRPVVQLLNSSLSVSFHQLFPNALFGDDLLARTHGWHERYERWLEEPPLEPVLAGCFHEKVPLEGGGGELGLCERGERGLELRSQGRPLPLSRGAQTWLPPGMKAVVDDPRLEADLGWNDVARGAALDEVLSRIEEAIRALFLTLSRQDRLEDPKIREAFINYLGWEWRRGSQPDRFEELPIFEVSDGSGRASLVEIRQKNLEVRLSPNTEAALSTLGLA